MNRVTYRLFCV